MSAQLRSTSQGRTMVLTMSHAEHRNALVPAMMAAGIEALNVAEGNAEISAVVLLGEGAHFCAGLAPQSSRHAEYDEAADLALFRQWLETLSTFPKPVVAALEGEVHDEGLLLALGCDLIIAAADCQLSASALASRLTPLAAHAGLLARRLPHALAFGLLTSQRPISPQPLHALGLIHQVCPSGQAYAAALELAEQQTTTSARNVMRVKDLLASLHTGASPMQA